MGEQPTQRERRGPQCIYAAPGPDPRVRAWIMPERKVQVQELTEHGVELKIYARAGETP